MKLHDFIFRFKGETYKLALYKSVYASNSRPYLWLIDTKDGEFFTDISVNDNDIETLPNEYLLNRDFVLCFDGDITKTRKRLEKNLNIQSWGINNWYHCFTL